MNREPRLINPWRLFNGAHVPEWLCRRQEVSAGAKLAYARLARFAGKAGVAWPFLCELAEELGVGERQARRYTAELETLKLIDIDRRGRGESNLYRFPAHEWMGLDGADISDPSRTDTSDLTRTDTRGRSSRDTSDRRERTHPTSVERTHPAAPFLTESVVQSQEASHCGDGPSAAAITNGLSLADHECWSTLVTAIGAEPETKSERGRFAVAVSQLVEIGATPAQIRSRVGAYRVKWPSMAVTPTAIAAHWSELATPAPRTPSRERPECGLCDSGWIPATGGVAPCPTCNVSPIGSVA